jgi:transposase
MLSFSTDCRYYLFSQPTDMRKGFNGLSGLIAHHTDFDLLNGDVFVFINKRQNCIKLLKWDVTGFALYYKRLEAGTFERPLFSSDNISQTLSWSSLVMLLEGIELKGVKRRKRYQNKG